MSFIDKDLQGSKDATRNIGLSVKDAKSPTPIKEKDGPLFLFRNGFGNYLQNGFLSDLRLIHSKKEYNVHQIILVHSSDYFATVLKRPVSSLRNSIEELDKKINFHRHPNGEKDQMGELNTAITEEVSDNKKYHSIKEGIREVTSEFQQYSKRVLKLSFPDQEEVFPLVVKYMYEGKININDDNALPLMSMAQYLQMEELRSRVMDYLNKNITRTNVLVIIQKALDYKIDVVIEKCLYIIARNFTHIFTAGASLNFLPLNIMKDLLNHNSLTVGSEYSVYKTIVNYFKSEDFQIQFTDSIPLEIRTSLFETVHFPYMTFEELQEATQEPLVPSHLLIEALMMRVALKEAPEKFQPNVFRLQKRPTIGRVFEYTSDFDEKGVLYYIGTKGHTAKWRNPCLVENGVTVYCSSKEKGDPINIVGRRPFETWTADIPSSWYCIDLGPGRTLLLTYITLRHGSNSRQDCLRNWVIQCSDDCKKFTILTRHRDEESINAAFASDSWPIANCSRPYRYFRILQTGRNSSNHNFLSLSGIELYGELYETNPSVPITQSTSIQNLSVITSNNSSDSQKPV